MNCQKERNVYEETRRRVVDLRLLLKDYTGSSKFHDSAPSGVWPEGVTEANNELREIRLQLETALEGMTAARAALNRCYQREGMLKKEKHTTVNLGVLLEGGKDRDWFRTVLSHDPSLDYIIEPDSVEKFFDYIIHIGKQGRRIKWLVLMGHGSKTHARIGKLFPHDIDINTIRKQLSTTQENYRNAQAEVALLKQQLADADNEKAIQTLSKQLVIAQGDLDSAEFFLEELRIKLARLEGLAEAMAPNALVGLLNCNPAGIPGGREMMRNLGKIFLELRGGRVVGCDGKIWIIKNKPLIAWLTGADDTALIPSGKMRELNVRPYRCGVPCLHFERYGFCDNRKSKDGGPCWMHR